MFISVLNSQMVRYLIVGGWNTVFGAAVYALLYNGFGQHVHYLLLLIPANILAITNAFLGYRYIVFRSRGRMLQEYLRCYVVYGGMMLFNALLLYLLVTLLSLAPPIANAFCVLSTTIVAYFSHKHFSFRIRPEKAGRAISHTKAQRSRRFFGEHVKT
ncbi:MAG TPA: GtrA family protein [Candidatus Latescibacteria bacterium]|nr:GtrA family protein [Candidatus Latescibacterota bacterium]